LHTSIFLRRVTRAVIAAAATAGSIGFMTAASRPADAHLVPGLAFRISSSLRVYGGDAPRGPDDEVMRGRGIAANNRARIEFLAFTPAPQGVTTDDYLIALDSGKSVIQHTATQRYTSATDMFGGPAVIGLGRVLGGGGRGFGGGDSTGGGGGGAARGGRGGRGPGGGGGPPGGARGPRGGRGGRGGGASGFLNQIELLDVNFKIDKLGAGDPIEGRATQHYRITADYRVVWGGQGFPAHAVTEVWSTDLPTTIPNPFEPLIVGDQSTDGPLIEYALKLRATRSQIEGTPIKVVTTTTFSGVREVVGFARYVGSDPTIDKVTVVQQTQITSIAPADVDAKLLVVPDNISLDPGQ
jgi:hypothetical protein